MEKYGFTSTVAVLIEYRVLKAADLDTMGSQQKESWWWENLIERLTARKCQYGQYSDPRIIDIWMGTFDQCTWDFKNGQGAHAKLTKPMACRTRRQVTHSGTEKSQYVTEWNTIIVEAQAEDRPGHNQTLDWSKERGTDSISGSGKHSFPSNWRKACSQERKAFPDYISESRPSIDYYWLWLTK